MAQAPPPVTPIASALADRYIVEQELGRGGIGIVFDGTDVELDRPVAVKRLRPDRADNEFARERFQREARLTGRLDHPVHAGSSTRSSAPPAGALVALTSPPCWSTMRWTMDSPRPVPPYRFE